MSDNEEPTAKHFKLQSQKQEPEDAMEEGHEEWLSEDVLSEDEYYQTSQKQEPEDAMEEGHEEWLSEDVLSEDEYYQTVSKTSFETTKSYVHLSNVLTMKENIVVQPYLGDYYYCPHSHCTVRILFLTNSILVKTTLGMTDSPLCRACMEEEETALHIIQHCPALSNYRVRYLGPPRSPPEITSNIKGLLGFFGELDWLE
ncbi:hypothetical protein RR48_01413 [Papilio machaon]|uniref:Uncharacterized protein n=1 Tax=Papilio machaon TaxID=76193 RepID=A0A0N1IDY2_PAPMA|nr:hypothetical protein RR48_01413 [Papilio machaon]